MQRYANLGGDSGIVSFETGADRICVHFQDGSSYLYTYASAGENVIERMKALAVSGEGLNSFINRRAKKLYERKGC